MKRKRVSERKRKKREKERKKEKKEGEKVSEREREREKESERVRERAKNVYSKWRSGKHQREGCENLEAVDDHPHPCEIDVLCLNHIVLHPHHPHGVTRCRTDD